VLSVVSLKSRRIAEMFLFLRCQFHTCAEWDGFLS